MVNKKIVHVDWKSAGSEYLPLLRVHFPEFEFLSSSEFDKLIDFLASESVENSLGPLAYFLSKFKADLWNLDSAADDFRLWVSLSKDRKETKANLATEINAIEPELVVPVPAQEVDDLFEKKRKKSDFHWFEDTYDFGCQIWVGDYNFFDGFVEHWDEAERGVEKFPVLFDFNQWPPAEIQPLQTFSAPYKLDSLNTHMAYHSAELMVWKVLHPEQPKDKNQKNGREKFLWYKVFQNGQWFDWGPKDLLLPSTGGKTLVLSDGFYEVMEFKVLRVTRETSEVVFESKNSLSSLQCGKDSFLIFEKDSGQIFRMNAGESKARDLNIKFPTEPYSLNSLAYLGDDRILYFHKHTSPHPEVGDYSNEFLQGNILNLATSEHLVANLDGFESIQKIETRVLNSAPSYKIDLHSMMGSLSVSKGHDDWWIWNLHTDAFGLSPRFWFWNQKSDEVVKVNSKMMPKNEPTILYCQSLKKYLLFETEFYGPMTPFEQVRGYAGASKILWRQS